MLGSAPEGTIQSVLTKKGGSTFGFSNFTGTNLAKWQAGLAARASGTRNAKLSCVGDSTTAGYGTGSGVGDGNAIANSWPNQLAGILANAKAQSMFATHNAVGSSIYDSGRVTIGGGWTATGGGATVGGNTWLNSGSAGTLAFTPSTSVDTFVVYYTTFPGFGTANANIDGGTNTPINENVAAGIGSVTLNAALGAHTLNVVWASGAIALVGIVAFNSAAKEISIYNMGWAASKVSNWLDSSQAYSPFPALTSFTSDLVIIDLTINDSLAGTALGTYSTQIQSLITQNQSTSDIILLSGNQTDPLASGGVSVAFQQTYVNAVKTLSQSNNIPMIDIFALMGSYANITAQGWAFTDGFHLNTAGYARIANYVKTGITSGFVSL